MLRILKNALSFLLFAGVLLVLVGLARPAFADPIAKNNPQYAEITQMLTDLQQLQADPNADLEAAGYTAVSLTQKSPICAFKNTSKKPAKTSEFAATPLAPPSASMATTPT